jgi:glycosyltransferase involved in cell wall biosynthesis
MPDGSSWPRVSIVTPSLNQGQFIEETIRSVLLQGYPNLEYLIVDGGSTDQSVEIIRKYERWLAFWVSEPDRGQSHAINKGWSRATGEIFAWLCSDDLYRPGVIGAAVVALSGCPTAGVVYANCQNIDEQGKPIVLRQPGEFDYHRLLWNLRSFIPQPTTFIRKSVLTDVGMVDETLTYSMDYELWLRIGLRYPFHYVRDLWACTRMHPNAKTVVAHKKNWKRKEAILRSVFASADLPPDLRNQETALYSTYYFQVAAICLRAWDVVDAAHYLKKAVALQPKEILDRENWRLIVRALLKVIKHGPRSTYMPKGNTSGIGQ